MDALDLTSAESTRAVFLAAAEANHAASCRRGSIDAIGPPGRLIATGDLHDNPIHLARLVEMGGFNDPGASDDDPSLPHLTIHEVIHSERLIGGVDLSHRALARVAHLKVRFPEHVHTLLANHELSQIIGAGIIKDGVKVVEAFEDGLAHGFGDEAESVAEAIGVFIRSMPLALRVSSPPGHRAGDILCAHSLPGPAMMGRFDPGILSRELEEYDYAPRQGSAHLMVWGRGYDAEQLEDLVERWGVNLFILGHEHAENGVRVVEPNAVILNSDHQRGVCLSIDLDDPPTDAASASALVVPLGE